MRVIAGRFRSRRLESVRGLSVRPTADRLRESLFSVLAPRIEATVFLDAYAGSGAVGIEALSRGAKHVVFIERSAKALEVLRNNLHSLDIGKDEATVIRGSAATLLHNHPCDLAFVDPPYNAADEYEQSLTALASTAVQLVVAQHPSRMSLNEIYGRLNKIRLLKQGDNSLSFYE